MAYFPPPESSGGWRRVTGINAVPTNAQKNDIRAKTGVDWDKLKLAYDYSQSFGGGSTVLVIRNGWIAGEWGNTHAARIGSVSKSLTALATARMYELSDAGRLGKTIGAESFAYDFLPATWDDDDARKRKIRIRHLTTMTSGLVPDDSPGQPNYLNAVLTQPIKVPPETEWSYASLPVDLLSIVIQSATGNTARNFFNQEIAGKIGIPALRWQTLRWSLPVALLNIVTQSATGNTVRNFFNRTIAGRIGMPALPRQILGLYTKGSCGAFIRPRDLARVGYLMMMDGAWNGRQIVAKSYISNIRQHPAPLDDIPFVPTPRSPSTAGSESPKFYAHLWWTNTTGAALGSKVPRDAYHARGFRENLLIVVPSLSMIVVRMGSNPESLKEFQSKFMSLVVDAVVTTRSAELVAATSGARTA
jgi:CubicO group peptidase (beta-lactamase class C family)